MSTVLRKQASILIRLREKMELHPFPSKHRGAGRASTQLLTVVCVGSVSLEFVLTKSDSDSENNAQHEKCWSLRSTAYPPLPSFTELHDKLAGPYREKHNNLHAANK